jgi:hypothetical protein
VIRLEAPECCGNIRRVGVEAPSDLVDARGLPRLDDAPIDEESDLPIERVG